MVFAKSVILVFVSLRRILVLRRRIDMKFITCPGSRIHTHYQSVFDGKHLSLVESGVTDIQESIEAFGKYTDLHYMLHRLSVGDRSVLSSRGPVYGDFSGLPTNPVDAINIVHSAENAFGQLSMEERASYNNDFRAWLAFRLSNPTPSSPSVPAPVPITNPVKEAVSE